MVLLGALTLGAWGCDIAVHRVKRAAKSVVCHLTHTCPAKDAAKK
jgi:hypothetical protein